MRFGKIDYINLIPFSLYLKKHIKSSGMRSVLAHKKGVPSAINRRFKRREIDAAVISSVQSFNEHCTEVGIVASKEVLSVLLIEGESRKDSASETSNALANVMELKGEVMIGDRALKAYYEGIEATDLAHAWYVKTGLPFVFGRLCCHKKPQLFRRLSRDFLRQRIFIPHYILEEYSQRTGVSKEGIRYYLGKIRYDIGRKEERSLRRFRGLVRKHS